MALRAVACGEIRRVAVLELVPEPEELSSEELMDDEEVDSSAPTVRCPVFPAPESGVRNRVDSVVSTDRLDSMEFELRQARREIAELKEIVSQLVGTPTVALADTKFPPPPRVPAFAAETCRPAKLAW